MDLDEDVVVIGLETGERLGEFDKGSRINVRSKNQIKYTKENIDNTITPKEANMDGDFVKIFRTVLGMLVEEKLNGTDYQIIFTCLSYLEYSSGAVKNHLGRFINITELSKIIRVSRQIVDEEVNMLVKKKILHKGKVGNTVQLFVNPYIFMRGQVINKTLYAMFKESKWYDKHACRQGKA